MIRDGEERRERRQQSNKDLDRYKILLILVMSSYAVALMPKFGGALFGASLLMRLGGLASFLP